MVPPLRLGIAADSCLSPGADKTAVPARVWYRYRARAIVIDVRTVTGTSESPPAGIRPDAIIADLYELQGLIDAS
jgi:hypothetical protein